jgi:hypothetical protein
MGHWNIFNGSSQPQIRELLALHVVHILNMASSRSAVCYLSATLCTGQTPDPQLIVIR